MLAADIVRSTKSLEAEFSEWLPALALGGVRAPDKNQAGYDINVADRRIQVKSINKVSGNANGYLLQAKDRRNDPLSAATHYAFVIFEDLIPSAVFLVPEEIVRTWPKTQIKRPDWERVAQRLPVDLTPFQVPPTLPAS
jgi:hypothetical protein